MFYKKENIENTVVAEMAERLESDEYKAIFAKPDTVVKTAAKKKNKDHNDDCPKDCPEDHGKDKKGKKNKKDDKENDKGKGTGKGKDKSKDDKKKKKAELTLIANGLNKISETLDNYDLGKSAVAALNALGVLISEAQAFDFDEDVVEIDEEPMVEDLEEAGLTVVDEEDAPIGSDVVEDAPLTGDEELTGEDLREIMRDLGVEIEGEIDESPEGLEEAGLSVRDII